MEKAATTGRQTAEHKPACTCSPRPCEIQRIILNCSASTTQQSTVQRLTPSPSAHLAARRPHSPISVDTPQALTSYLGGVLKA